MTIVLSPEWAQREIERVVTRARMHPDKTEHFFALMPAQSRDLLAYSMFVALVENGALTDAA